MKSARQAMAGLLSLCSAAAFLLPVVMSGQQSLCTPDCPDNQWSQIKYITVSMENGCAVNVGYVERMACNGKIDFQFVGIYNWPSDACNRLQEILDQDGAEAEQLLQTIHGRAMQALIASHFASLPGKPLCDQAVDISYRVTYGACSIKRVLYEHEGVRVYLTEKCGSSCCIHLYTACLDGAEIRVTNATPAGSNDLLCPFSSGDPFTRCHHICYED